MKKTEWILLALSVAGLGYFAFKGRGLFAALPRAGSVAASSSADGAYRPTIAGTYSYIDSIAAAPDASPISRAYEANWLGAVNQGASAATASAIASGNL